MKGHNKNSLGILMRMQILAFVDKLTKFRSKSKGMTVLISISILYCIGLLFFFTIKVFGSAAVLCQYHMGWFYFAFCGLCSLAICLFTSVMMAENLIFAPKDNELLFAMPIKPRNIFLSRILVLLLIDFIFTLLLFGVAIFSAGKYISIGFPQILGMFVAIVGITLMAQAIVCIFAWLLHFLLSKTSPVFASLLFMVIFISLYFFFITKGNVALTKFIEDPKFARGLLVESGIDELMKSAGWPLYAMGMSVMGDYVYMALFATLSLSITGITWWILSRSFIKTALMEGKVLSGKKDRKIEKSDFKIMGVYTTVAKKEFAHFLNSPVYLTDSGVGMIIMIMATIACVFTRSSLLEALSNAGLQEVNLSVLVFLCCGFFIASSPATAPNISLEGKELWILRGLPISAKDILLGKLKFHLMFMCPIVLVCFPALNLLIGGKVVETVILTIAILAFVFLSGVLGLVLNLTFPRFDWEKEATPCKQSLSVVLSLFVEYGILILVFIVFMVTQEMLFTISCTLVLFMIAALSGLLYAYLLAKGTKKWNSFDC